MDADFLEMKDLTKHDEYSIRESNMTMQVYKEELYHDGGGKSYNFKTEQDKIVRLVNDLNNSVKKYRLFVNWLSKCGFIDKHVLDTFNDIMAYDNPILRIIDKKTHNGDVSIAVYETLKENGYL